MQFLLDLLSYNPEHIL